MTDMHPDSTPHAPGTEVSTSSEEPTPILQGDKPEMQLSSDDPKHTPLGDTANTHTAPMSIVKGDRRMYLGKPVTVTSLRGDNGDTTVDVEDDHGTWYEAVHVSELLPL